MDLAWLFPYVLFLHVLGAIVAFGPTFAFPIIGAMGGKEPQYSNFATRVSATITDRMVIPLGIFQGVTGVLLIWISGRDLFASAWLLIAIVLYAFTLAYALTVQRRHVHKIIELSSKPPPPDAKGPPPGLMDEVRAVPARWDSPDRAHRDHRVPDGGQAVVLAAETFARPVGNREPGPSPIP